MPGAPIESFIQAIGTAVPAHTLLQQDAARIARETCGYSARQAQWSDRIYERVRVRRRGCAVLNGHSATEERFSRFPVATDEADGGPGTADRLRWYAEAASLLAGESAGAALAKSGVAASQITHLVTASCTGFDAPGVDVRLIESLGLDPGVARTNIGFMGCHAALNALRVASAFVRADAEARVLVCAVEVCSVHFSYGRQPDRMLGNALFADGSASAVVGSVDSARVGESVGGHGEGSGGHGGVRIAASGSHIVPDSHSAMGWSIGDHGFDMSLSKQLPEIVADRIRPWMEDWLARSGLSIDGVGSWAIHPGGPRILEAVAGALGLDADAMADSFGVLESHGNMSSPTILFILDRLLARGDGHKSSMPCVCLGFGPGLAIEAMLVDQRCG